MTCYFCYYFKHNNGRNGEKDSSLDLTTSRQLEKDDLVRDKKYVTLTEKRPYGLK